LKPPYKQITRAIVARIHRIQLMAFLTVSRNADPVKVCDSDSSFFDAFGLAQSVALA
jgi:hypothetical protein